MHLFLQSKGEDVNIRDTNLAVMDKIAEFGGVRIKESQMNDEKIKFRMREQGLQHITDSIDDNIRLEHAYRCGFDVLKKLVGEESSMELTTGQVLCCADMCLCLDGVYNSSFRKSAIGGGGCRHVFACRIQDQIDAGEMTIADLEENLSLFLINRFDADAAILSDGDCSRAYSNP